MPDYVLYGHVFWVQLELIFSNSCSLSVLNNLRVELYPVSQYPTNHYPKILSDIAIVLPTSLKNIEAFTCSIVLSLPECLQMWAVSCCFFHFVLCT